MNEINEVYKIMDEMFKEFSCFSDIFSEIPRGKGVRAKLITSINPDAKILAASIETIHLASLLHDDVIDGSNFRRGKRSLNAKYGNEIAILVGNILFTKAIEKLMEFDTTSAKELTKTIYTLNLGEMEDIKLSENINLNKEKYLQMSYKKTASLIEMGCREAARLKNLESEKYGRYGRNLGLVYQIIDDILDIVGDEKILGKPVMNDLQEGKMTLPLIYLYEGLNEKERDYFKTLFKKRLNDDEKNWIKLKSQNAIKKSYEYAKKLAQEGIEEIEEPYLRELMMKLIERKF